MAGANSFGTEIEEGMVGHLSAGGLKKPSLPVKKPVAGLVF